jgi:hypothetical protein
MMGSRIDGHRIKSRSDNINFNYSLCGLFYSTVSNSTIWHQMVGYLINDELERIWKEIVIA